MNVDTEFFLNLISYRIIMKIALNRFVFIALSILMFYLLLSVSGFIGLSLASGPEDKPGKDGSTVIATTDNWQLTYDDIQRILSYYPEQQVKQLKENPKNIIKLVERLVQARVLSDIARAEKFDQRPDIAEQLELFVRDKLASAYVRYKVLDKIHPSEQDLKMYYSAHKKNYHVPKRIRVRHILIRLPLKPTKKQVEAAKKRIMECIKEIKAGTPFGDVAVRYSEDPASRTNGGDLGWVARDKLEPKFAKAAFSAKPKVLKGPVRTRFGFHVLEVTDQQPAKQLAFAEVKDRVRKDYMQEIKSYKVSSFIEEAEKKAHASIDKNKLMDMLLH